LLHEFLIEVHAIRQMHISKGALVLVVAVGPERDLFPKDEGRGRVLGLPSAQTPLIVFSN
jgi:hypothetical protein